MIPTHLLHSQRPWTYSLRMLTVNQISLATSAATISQGQEHSFMLPCSWQMKVWMKPDIMVWAQHWGIHETLLSWTIAVKHWSKSTPSLYTGYPHNQLYSSYCLLLWMSNEWRIMSATYSVRACMHAYMCVMCVVILAFFRKQTVHSWWLTIGEGHLG